MSNYLPLSLSLKQRLRRKKLLPHVYHSRRKIDQFQLEEEVEARADPIKIPDSEGELDKSSVARSPQLIIAKVDSNSEEEDAMALNPRKGLTDLMAERNKGLSSKEAPKSQLPLTLPPYPPSPTTTANLLFIPN